MATIIRIYRLTPHIFVLLNFYKMKNKISILFFVFSLMLMNACKKNDNETSNESLDPNVAQFNDDSNRYKSETDQADGDINDQLKGMPGFDNATGVTSSPMCGAIIDTSQLSQKIVIFNFDGVTPCFSPSRTRAGQIKVQLTSGNLWADTNAVLTITYINFKITRLSDHKSITFNGVKTLKNINGNNWLSFLSGNATFKYQERAYSIQVTFDNNLNATWNSAHITEWTYTPSDVRLNFTSNGDTTIAGIAHVDSWGTNRYGKSFTTYYTAPIYSNSYCGLWRFNAGELVHWVNGKNFLLTLGVNEQGNPSTLACAYGYKVSWTGVNGNMQSVVLSY